MVDFTVPMQIDMGEAAGYLDHLISPEGPVADRDDAEIPGDRVVGLIVVSLTVVAYALVSKRLAATPISGPMLFMVLGVALGPAWPVQRDPRCRGSRDDRAAARGRTALVLFTDSLEISSAMARQEAGCRLRLLHRRMPLMMIWGGGSRWRCSPASTSGGGSARDLSGADGCRARSGRRVRAPGPGRGPAGAENIESGLNDGLSPPVLRARARGGDRDGGRARTDVVEAFLDRSCWPRRSASASVGSAPERSRCAAAWMRSGVAGVDREHARVSLLAFASADAMEGSGFIATWVAGVAFGRSIRVRWATSPCSQKIWARAGRGLVLGFGAVLLVRSWGTWSRQVLVYTALSLTLP